MLSALWPRARRPPSSTTAVEQDGGSPAEEEGGDQGAAAAQAVRVARTLAALPLRVSLAQSAGPG
jgi:hypothetical protein